MFVGVLSRSELGEVGTGLERSLTLPFLGSGIDRGGDGGGGN